MNWHSTGHQFPTLSEDQARILQLVCGFVTISGNLHASQPFALKHVRWSGLHPYSTRLESILFR